MGRLMFTSSFAVENVMRIIFRLTRTSSDAIFPYNSRAQNILIHFRFAAQSFMMSFTSYVYDTAIGGNFDAFLARISSAESSPDLAAENYFSDVFSLMQRHSRVMDDILSACLLRSVQKAVREILEAVLGSIVEFGVLVGNVKNGHVKAAEAALKVEELFDLFKEKRNLLVGLPSCFEFKVITTYIFLHARRKPCIGLLIRTRRPRVSTPRIALIEPKKEVCLWLPVGLKLW